jgi:colicin import membrane protein
VRTTGRSLALVLSLLLAGPLHAQAPAATDDEQPVAEPPSMGAPEEPGKDAADQSPKEMIGSRWPAKPEDAPPPFAVVKKTDRLGEAMREAQAAQEAAAKAAAEQAAADARAEERAAEQTSNRQTAGRHVKGKRLAARGRASARARAATAKTTSAGRKAAAKATAKSTSRQKAVAKTTKGGAAKKQAGKAARRHRA